jgi:hypothetical protein
MKGSTVLTALVTLLGLLALGLSISTATTSTTCEVTPTTYSDLGPGGNVDCTDIGAYQFTSGRLDGGAQCGGTAGESITWSTDATCTYVDWSFVKEGFDQCGLAVILKGGNAANVYVYDESCQSDSGLASPPTPSGMPAELSNITFCWNECPEESQGEWCSPGYWKNHPDEADVAAAACGINLDTTTYSSEFGAAPPRSPLGIREGAPEDPTLRQVLDNPQWYGGPATNLVADRLSDCHPDVDFQGSREASCPLD